MKYYCFSTESACKLKHFSCLGPSSKIHHSMKWVVAFKTIHTKQFPLAHYSGISNFYMLFQQPKLHLSCSMLLKHNNATPYNTCHTRKLLQSYHWQLLDQPPYFWSTEATLKNSQIPRK